MKSPFLAAMTAVLILGCQPAAEEMTLSKLPEGLSDCKFFRVYDGAAGRPLTVVRCPNSHTTVDHPTGSQYGKAIDVTAVIEEDAAPTPAPPEPAQDGEAPSEAEPSSASSPATQ